MRDRNTVFVTDISTRSVIGEYESNGIYTVSENLKEVKQHEKSGCTQKLTDKDIDGDKTTASHTHIMNIDEAYIEVFAKKILENDSISSVYNKQDIKNKLREKLKDKKELSKETLNEEVENIEQEIEEQAEQEHEMPAI